MHETRSFSQLLIHWEDLFGRPGMMLVVGCGSSDVMRLAQSRHWSVIGIDLSFENVQRLKAEVKVPAAVADPTALPFLPGMFDVVVFFDSLQATFHHEAAVAEAQRVLQPEGFACTVSLALETVAVELAQTRERLEQLAKWQRVQKHKPTSSDRLADLPVLSLLYCPHCLNGLQPGQFPLIHCAGCGEKYEVRNGVPVLVSRKAKAGSRGIA